MFYSLQSIRTDGPAYPLPRHAESHGGESATGLRRVALFGICLFVATIPTEEVLKIPGVGSIAQLSGLLAGALGALAMANRPTLVSLTSAMKWIVVALAFACCSTFWSTDSESATSYLIRYLQLMLMVLLLSQLAESDRERRRVMQAYVYGAFVLVAALGFNYLAGRKPELDMETGRYTALGCDPNDLGVMLALGIPISWYLAAGSWNTWSAKLNLLYIPGALGGVLVTGSRGAALAVAGALLVIPASYKAISPRARLWMLVLLAALVTLVATVDVPGKERIFRITDEVQSGTFTGRTNIWRAAIRAFWDEPMLGSGIGTSQDRIYQYLGQPVVTHNAFLGVLLEQGVVGLIIFGAMLLAIVATAWRRASQEKILTLGLLLTWCIGAASLSLQGRKVTWAVLFIAATAVGMRMIQRQARPSQSRGNGPTGLLPRNGHQRRPLSVGI